MQSNKVELNKVQVEEFKEYLYERENAEATIQKYLTDIRTFFRFLGDDLIISKKRLLSYKEWLKDSYMVNSANSIIAALNQFLEFLGLGIWKIKRFKMQKAHFFWTKTENSQRQSIENF